MIWKLINKPFPINSWRCYLQRSLGFGLFVFLFLFLFKPFSLNLYSTQQLLYTAAIYGGITWFVIFTGGWVFTLWAVPRVSEEKWTLGKQILWNTLLMLCITFLNIYVTQLMHNITLPLWWWFNMLSWVVMLGVFPIAIAELIAYNVYLRQHIKSAVQISQIVQHAPKPAVMVPVDLLPVSELQATNHHHISERPAFTPDVEDSIDILKHTLVLTGENQGDKLEILYNNLLAVQALDNYVNIFWEQKGCLQTTMLRNTLTNISEQLNDAPCMYRSHRGWLVNTKRVTQVEGNAQGLRLSVDLLPQHVPVSRTNITGYRQLTEVQQLEVQH